MLTREALELLKLLENGAIGGASEEYVLEQINNLKDNVNPNLDTLNKIANAINNDVNFHTTVTQAIAQSLTNSKQYTDSKINAIDLIDIQVLAVLPPSGEVDVLYMIGNVNTTDIFELYIWENNKFIKVGSTTIDLSQYALKSEIPVNLSQLTNDTNFITQGDIPTNLSELTNDTNFITVSDIINDTSSATNKTYSSNKIDQLLQTVQPVANAQDVSYTDNKGLGATNVQEAIDKTVDRIPSNANQINFTSAQGIVANNVGGALDELKQDLANAGGASTAQDVSYDDSTTQLGATNVQDVIIALKNLLTSPDNNIRVKAINTSYDDSTTQLGATNVQGAINVLDNKIKDKISKVNLFDNQW